MFTVEIFAILESLSTDVFEPRTATGRLMFKILGELLLPKNKLESFHFSTFNLNL